MSGSVDDMAQHNSARKSADYWGRKPPDDELLYHWVNNPVARRHLNRRISGRDDAGAIERWQELFIPHSLDHVLSVGCGFGEFERQLIKLDVAKTVHGVDISERAIADARASAIQAGYEDRISYDVVDLNAIDLPAARYDGIFAVSSIHHIQALEGAFSSFRQALKPGALLFIDEYVGPARFQFDDTILGLMNGILEILPARFKLPLTRRNAPRETMTRMPLSWFDENDPSEAIRSDEIMTTLLADFDIVDLRPYGGAIQHLMLSEIAGNFLVDVEEDRALLRLIGFIEDTLEEHGVIGSDFAAIVARPR